MDTSKNNLSCQKELKSGQILISEKESIKSNGLDGDFILQDTELSTSSPFKCERTEVICFGITGIILIVIANLIILGNNVVIKEYGIDYVDMILLRSAVQLLTLGMVIKMKGNSNVHKNIFFLNTQCYYNSMGIANF